MTFHSTLIRLTLFLTLGTVTAYAETNADGWDDTSAQFQACGQAFEQCRGTLSVEQCSANLTLCLDGKISAAIASGAPPIVLPPGVRFDAFARAVANVGGGGMPPIVVPAQLSSGVASWDPFAGSIPPQIRR